MKLTRAGEYGIRFVLFLARQEPGTVHNRREIAEAMAIPYQFLSKVANYLTKAGLVTVVQGARGGYRLARPKEEVTLLEVIETVEGPIFLNECLCGLNTCGFQSGCAVHQVWAKAQQGLKETLSSATFAELVRQDDHVSGIERSPKNQVIC
jgi:Rrf2 family transcriptional regulator, iron-sulfur cluster assembly transcription factor